MNPAFTRQLNYGQRRKSKVAFHVIKKAEEGGMIMDTVYRTNMGKYNEKVKCIDCQKTIKPGLWRYKPLFTKLGESEGWYCIKCAFKLKMEGGQPFFYFLQQVRTDRYKKPLTLGQVYYILYREKQMVYPYGL